jgi:hypothetical protein
MPTTRTHRRTGKGFPRTEYARSVGFYDMPKGGVAGPEHVDAIEAHRN